MTLCNEDFSSTSGTTSARFRFSVPVNGHLVIPKDETFAGEDGEWAFNTIWETHPVAEMGLSTDPILASKTQKKRSMYMYLSK